MSTTYDVAAYIWPSYHDEPRARLFWPGHEGEWINVRTSKPKFPGHRQPRHPLWGYQNEADPRTMEMQIDAAADHGINVFAYDWYWYDRAPFLEACLNNGFLKARNNHRMRFFLMWANHDVTHLWDRRAQEPGGIVWKAAWDRDEFEIIGRRWIDRYFTHPRYYCIGGKPVLSVFRPQTMVEGLGGIDATRRALQWLDDQCRAAGLPGVHLQAIFAGGRLGDTMGLVGESGGSGSPPGKKEQVDLYTDLPFASLTNYQWVSMASPRGTYADWSERALAGEQMAADQNDKPFFPTVSVGWDNNARFPELKEGYVLERNPEIFRRNLEAARATVDQRGLDPKLILINAWNEWTEDSYLLPDREFGYGYLEAVRDVFGESSQ
jgi:hypothetical protein